MMSHRWNVNLDIVTDWLVPAHSLKLFSLILTQHQLMNGVDDEVDHQVQEQLKTNMSQQRPGPPLLPCQPIRLWSVVPPLITPLAPQCWSWTWRNINFARCWMSTLDMVTTPKNIVFATHHSEDSPHQDHLYQTVCEWSQAWCHSSSLVSCSGSPAMLLSVLWVTQVSPLHSLTWVCTALVTAHQGSSTKTCLLWLPDQLF